MKIVSAQPFIDREEGKPASRLGSLDMLRGISLAGMVLANCPGSRQHMYGWLRHAGWTGCGFADLVFPFFLFAAGAALSCSLARSAHSGKMPLSLLNHTMRRAAGLFLLGLALNALPGLLESLLYGAAFSPGQLRIMGVLQRIALLYAAAAMCIVLLPERALRILTALLILGYSGALAVSSGNLTPENNPALAFDTLVLGAGHLFRGGLDPEGLFSSVSALSNVLLGYAAGRAIGRGQNGAAKVFAAGVSGIALGWLWGMWLPVCKDLWTGPYALVTAGCASVVLALCQWVLCYSAIRRAALPLQILGRHSLLFFVGSGITARLLLAIKIGGSTTLWSSVYDLAFVSWLGRSGLSSLAFATAYLAAGWLAVLALDASARRGGREA